MKCHETIPFHIPETRGISNFYGTNDSRNRGSSEEQVIETYLGLLISIFIIYFQTFSGFLIAPPTGVFF